MKSQLTAAVIGCGAIAQHLHLPGYAAREDVTRIVVADTNPERFAEIVKPFRVNATYTDYREMLAGEHPDVVSICTPNCYHAEQAIAALEAGAHVLLEKPMAITMESAQAVAEASARTGGKVMIGFSHRFHRRNQRAKELLSEGAIGEPFMFRARFAHSGPFPGWAKSDWFYNRELAGGGALLDMGIHAIDLCQWLIGPITSVAAQIGTLRKDIAVDDNAVLALSMGTRALGYIEVGWTSGAGFCGWEIYGDQGTIINDYEGALRICRGMVTPDHTAEVALTWETIADDPRPDGWAIEVDHFIETLRAGDEFTTNPHAGITALAVALAANESAQTGRRIELVTANV